MAQDPLSELVHIGARGGCPLATLPLHPLIGEAADDDVERALALEVVDAICATVDAAFAEDPSLAQRFPRAPAARGAPTAMLRRFVTDRPGHDRRYAVDASRAAAELGHRPRHSFHDALARTLRWYLDHEAWWRMARRRIAAPRAETLRATG